MNIICIDCFFLNHKTVAKSLNTKTGGGKKPLLFQSHDTREKSYFSRIMQGLTFTLGTNENFISNYFSQQNMIPIISDDVTMDTEKDR